MMVARLARLTPSFRARLRLGCMQSFPVQPDRYGQRATSLKYPISLAIKLPKVTAKGITEARVLEMCVE
jgi:hypothetical protein